MTQLQQKLVIPAAVLEKLESVRGRTFRVSIGTAIVAALGVLLAAMGLAMLFDYLATLYDSRWRVVLTLSAYTLTAITLGAWMAVAWWRSRRVDRLAAQVDREIPELEERWSTVTGISANARPGEVHPAMYQKVAEEARGWSPRFHVSDVVPLDGLIRALMVLTTITLVLGIASMLDVRRSMVLVERFFRPTSSISATQILEVPGDSVIPRGSSLELSARLEGSPVAEAALVLKPSQGDEQTILLTPLGDEQNLISHRLRTVDSDLEYRIRAGDGQTEWYHITVADRPEIAETRVTLTPPVYTRQEPKSLDKLPRRISAIAGTQMEFAFRPRQAVESFALSLGADEQMPLTLDAEGWYRWQTTLENNFAVSPLLTEEHGLTNHRPPVCEVRCQEDRPPVVKVVTPNDAMAVRPGEKVPITFVAKDDVGIAEAELVVFDQSAAGEPVELDTILVPLGEQMGSTEVKGTVELDLAKYNVVDGGEISFAIRVREDRGQVMLAGGSPTQPQMQPTETANGANQTISPTAAQSASAEPQQPSAQPATNSSQQTAASASPNGSPNTESAQSSPSATMTAQVGNSNPAEQTPADDGQSRTASSGRQSLAAGDSQAMPSATQGSPSGQQSAGNNRPQSGGPSQPNDNNSPASSAQANANAGSQQANPENNQSQQTGSASQQNQASASQTAQSSPNNSPSNSSPNSSTTPPPGNSMTPRQLDIPQGRSSSSQSMRLRIDQWAGSFEGQEREKIELAIAPVLADLDQALEKAQKLSRSVLDEVDAAAPWDNQHSRDVTAAERQVAAAIKLVEDLEAKSHGTPYAFVGLQLVDINTAHISPARRDFWKALQSSGDLRPESTRNGWQHATRARELLVQLNERFETTRREYKLADSVEKIKKMYQVFIENSMALMKPEGEGGRYSRKMVEFELDDEYLARLKEVMEMREQMRAELARILAEDPRLLRRFLDAQRNRTNVLRNELDRLAERQENLNRETKAWEMADDSNRAALSKILLGRHVETAQDVAVAAADLHDRFQTWVPLGEAETGELKTTADLLQEIATSTQELSADGQRFADRQSQAKLREEAKPATNVVVDSVEQTSYDESPGDEAVDAILADAEALYDQFGRLELSLRQLGLADERPEVAVFATNRLIETRAMIEQTSAWIRQLKQQQAGNYARSAEVEQYRLAMETDEFAGKLANLEQTLAGLMQQDNMLPENVAVEARAMMTALDEQAAPNQLAAVYALRRDQVPRATSRQATAHEALLVAGEHYDKMIDLAIKELDKLPVQDPIASLLEDPTLDELLAELENEVPMENLLGIPRRPSNLRIMSDWLRSGGDNALMTGGNGGRRLMMSQMRNSQMMRQRQLDRAYRRAVARALKEAEAEDLVKEMPELAQEVADWNVLLSQLGDDLQQGREKAPPERYRRAIEQYFRQVSGKTNEE